ncbi:MAG: 50S ribosomal protein L21 [Candidatus Falkowbacteria bacterium]|nr:50S ribosomal protein L21 [Candidatus Falkowbacteria bacterium]
MKFAVIKTGGKQYTVKEKDIVSIEKLVADDGGKVIFDTLMTFDDKGEIDLGTPTLGEKVEAKVISTAKTDKVSVIKYKNKTRYRRNVGHRQIMTKVEITKIS